MSMALSDYESPRRGAPFCFVGLLPALLLSSLLFAVYGRMYGKVIVIARGGEDRARLM